MSRVFRLCGIQTGGGDLVLSALQLRSGSNALVPVSITASHSPTTGVVSDLLNTADLAAACTWPKDVSTAPGFYVELTFDADVAPDTVVLGSGPNRSEFVTRFSLVQLSASLWQVVLRGDRVAWVAPQTLHTVGGGDSLFSNVALLLPLASDAVHKGLAPLSTSLIGGSFVADARALRGAALNLAGSGGVSAGGLTDFAFMHDGVTPYTVDFDFLHVGSSATQVLVSTSVTSQNPGMFIGVLASGHLYVSRFTGDSSTVYRKDILVALSTTTYTTVRFAHLGANNIRVDINGVTVFSGVWPRESGSSNGSSAAQAQPLTVGYGRVNGSNLLHAAGRISDVRITKSVRPLEAKTTPWPLSAGEGLESPRLSVSRLLPRRWLGAPPLTSKPLIAMPTPSRLDREFGGNGCIYGTVELYAQAGNIPLPRRVRLHRSRDGQLVRETWSDAQGNYRFDHISQRYTYDVIAWDHEGLQQSVVANDLTPEVMP